MPENGQELQEERPGGHLRRHLIGYTLGTVGVACVAGYLYFGNPFDKDDAQPNPDIPAQTASDGLPEQSFEQDLDETQEVARTNPAVLTNYALSRIIDGEYADGKNSVEQIKVVASSCTTDSGRQVSANSISRIVFRNRPTGGNDFETGYLTKEHIDKTEVYRTNYREEKIRLGYAEREPVVMSDEAKADIYRELTAEVCGTPTATINNPRIGSHTLLVDQAAYNGRPSYSPEEDEYVAISGSIKKFVGGLLVVGTFAIGGLIIFDSWRRKRNEKSTKEEFEEDRDARDPDQQEF